ncbi:hypothetical protein NSP_45590 [Nodularia spumigena CCY9414]|nr:hypothetical protein NSP_45590 [Nodularia spumigena CCY9414]
MQGRREQERLLSNRECQVISHSPPLPTPYSLLPTPSSPAW